MTAVEFGTPSKKREFNSNQKKTQFLDLTSTATIRILTTSREEIFTHYMNRSTVYCLGDDCPVCRSNKAIIMQNPENFRDEPHYSPRRELKLVNVMDKTPARECECGLESRTTTGAVTCKCGKIITGDAKPLNKIKVLSRGVQLFDDLDAIDNARQTPEREKVGITNYDVTLVVSGSGTTKRITPIPGEITGPETFDPADLFDLEKVTVRLEPSEMLDLQRGVSLRDIFAARRASEKSKALDFEFVSKESLEQVNSTVEDLFKGLE